MLKRGQHANMPRYLSPDDSFTVGVCVQFVKTSEECSIRHQLPGRNQSLELYPIEFKGGESVLVDPFKSQLMRHQAIEVYPVSGLEMLVALANRRCHCQLRMGGQDTL